MQLFVPAFAYLRLAQYQYANMPDPPAAASQRHWYFCTGPSSGTPTEAEIQAGIEVSQDVTCTRELTFKELCCADFRKFPEYLKVGSPAPYGGARHVTMTSAAAQVPALEAASPGFQTIGLLNDAAGLPRQTPTLRICTTQYASGDIAGNGDPVRVTGQLCDNEEFIPADLDGGALVLDTRISFLEKQGLPGSSIPVCWEQFQAEADGVPQACPATSGRRMSGMQGFNSASAAVLDRIGKKLPAAAALQVEEDLARLPGNAPLTAAEAHGEQGAEREHRTQIRTLKALVGLAAEEIQALLGDRTFDVGLGGKVLRLHVDHVTGGAEVRIAGTLDGEPATVQISQTQAALVRKQAQPLGLDDVVFSTIGAGKRWGAGAMMTSGSFTMSASSASL